MNKTKTVEKYIFLVEWFDPEASFSKKFYLSYFLSDDTLELFDIKNHRLFLKRTKCDGLSLSDIYVGGTVKIFSRLMKILDYADAETRKKLSHCMQKTFAFIKPHAIAKKGLILDAFSENGFILANLKMVLMNNDLVRILFRDQTDDYSAVLKHEQALTAGPSIVLELIAENSVQKLKDIAGPEDPLVALSECPKSLRGIFGKDCYQNVIHVADSVEAAEKQSQLFFSNEQSISGKNFQLSMSVTNSTCCIIKPHALQEGLAGKIITMIEDNNFKITGMKMFYLNTSQAEEFLEVYKSVVPEYVGMVNQLSSGPSIAMTVESEIHGPQTPQEFRNLIGPADPEIAKELRPNTVRANFGKDKVKNAVHVTDLPDDAPLEIEYFFKLLD